LQVPAELLAELVDGYEGLAKDVSGEMSDGKLWPEALDLIARVRGLLPAPAPTCPNCRHADRLHMELGCAAVAGDPATTFDVVCDCPFHGAALPVLRDLLAAQADAKPSTLGLWAPLAEPRVWNVGDPEPAGVTAGTRGTNPLACRLHQPDDTERYPVIVTLTEKHVVWVEAVDAEDAWYAVRDEPWEYANKKDTLVECWSEAEAPDADDYQTVIYEPGQQYPDPAADAHVKVWEAVQRQAKKDACAAAGHPDRETDPWGTTCRVCYIDLPAPEAVAHA
jgi:hypothetical protein